MEYKLIETKFGDFLVKPGDLVSDELIKGNFWEPELLPIFNKYIDKNSLVLEIGSYFGDHTVYLSKIAKSVFAYEGFQRNYYHLIANLLLNECYNVLPHLTIVGDGTDVREARSDCGDAWYPDWSNNAAGARFVPGFQFGTTKLDKLVLGRFEFLKIDAEGMDLKVMKGGENVIRKYNPVIVFEYNELITEPFSEYDAFLKSIHYNYEKIDWYNYLALPERLADGLKK